MPYLSYKEYMRARYGEPLYSVPIDLDLGCPNRSRDGTGGCTFCPENGARAAQTLDAKSIEDQMQYGIAFARKRYKAKRFMLYLQAYSGTFTSLQRQKKLYSNLLSLYPFDALSVGTRPDCLGESTLEYLRELNQQIDVSIDLGVQTLNDRTLLRINREHDAACSINAINELRAYGIRVFAHIMVGLPGENRSDWDNTVKKLVLLGVDGIKIHNLHVIKNTALHSEYTQQPFKTLNEYEYAEELVYLLHLIPRNIAILRFNTDTPDIDLVAPIWHMQKGQFAKFIRDTMQYRFGKSRENQDFWNAKYRAFYYPKSGAIAQAQKLFLAYSQLKERLDRSDVRLLDIGYGYGINSSEALNIKAKNRLHVSALDQDATIVPEQLPKQIDLKIGDIRYTLGLLDGVYDVIFLDPFADEKNPSMISLEVFKLLKGLLAIDGVLVCSTTLHASRVAIAQAGMQSEIVASGDIRGLVVKHGPQVLDGIPYRDPYLIYSDKQISTNREKQIARSL